MSTKETQSISDEILTHIKALGDLKGHRQEKNFAKLETEFIELT